MSLTSTTHTLFALDELAPGGARKVEVDGHTIAIVRIDDDVYALGDTCSHDEVSLSEGYVEADDRAIECWRHGALFDLATGEPLSLPATRAVPVYEVAVVGGQVELTVRADEEARDDE
jgi:3-phenylpropionate/trans-cinnamate dioxygenase ferredoxin subunit